MYFGLLQRFLSSILGQSKNIDGKVAPLLLNKYTIGKINQTFSVMMINIFYSIILLLVDHEYDAVVVGAGGAGLRAAMGCAEVYR